MKQSHKSSFPSQTAHGDLDKRMLLAYCCARAQWHPVSLFCFSLTQVCVCGRQQNKEKFKKDTEHERVQFWVATEHERDRARISHGLLKGAKADKGLLKPRYFLISGCAFNL